MENTTGFVVLQSQHAPVHSQQQIEDSGGCLAASARLLVGRRQAVLERGSTVETGEDWLARFGFSFSFWVWPTGLGLGHLGVFGFLGFAHWVLGLPH